MRFSQAFIRTSKDDPADAEIISHKLLMRAGFIRKLASGIYIMMPLANLAIKKIENIIRSEMNKAGAQEVIMPCILPAALWQETGRWEIYGDEMLRIKDRAEREYCFGPTHEEVITDLVRHDVKSYKQLPVILYQVQTKFRDEIRPRFGLMRAREFTMKDAYSFETSYEQLDINYKKMYAAYCNIFKRCGLKYTVVEADSGAIGGSSSNEFMVVAPSGEDAIVHCDKCGYSANVEKATTDIAKILGPSEKPSGAKPEKIHTPGASSIEDLAKFLNVPKKKLCKILFYTNGKAANDGREDVVVLVSGEFELNEIKLKNYLDFVSLELIPSEEVQARTGAYPGFGGPIGIKPGIKIIADASLKYLSDFVIGANEKDYHTKNVNLTDFKVDVFVDLMMVDDKHPCPKCGEKLEKTRGIEVGHIFKLGTKYSEKLHAYFIDESGKEKPIIMGCYGIGVGRTMQSAVEQNNDKDGICWPMPIAPYHVELILLNVNDATQKQVAEELYEKMKAENIEVIYDDRNEKPGFKFKDADLLGFPIRVTVGRDAASGKVEFKRRTNPEVKVIEIKDVINIVKCEIQKEII
ncbi:MAG: proline--tRNA ligase [Candidatus Wallbacteria bacterium]